MKELDDQELWDLISILENELLAGRARSQTATLSSACQGNGATWLCELRLCLALTNRLCSTVFARSIELCIEPKTSRLAG